MCKLASSCLLILVNVLVLIIGLALIIIGALMRWGKDVIVEKVFTANIEQKPQLVNIFTSLHVPGIAILILGCILFIVSFCGCFGVFCKNRVLLGIYLVIVGIALIFFLVVLILLFIYPNFVSDVFGEVLSKIVKDANARDVMKMIEQNAKCCGAKDPIQEYNNNLPSSCCATAPCSAVNKYKSCSIVLGEMLEPKLTMVQISIGVICGVFLFLMILTAYIITRFNKEVIHL